VLPPETTQLTFQVLLEHDRLLEQLVEESSIATDKGELLRLIIADHTNTTGATSVLSHPRLSGVERVQTMIEEQQELLESTSDELTKDGEASVETMIERLDEISRRQREIVDILSQLKDNRI
jgi:hypothetical protein